jgi:CDP-diacylglycerol--glycerol-3-phosphate 3-phosphatidyltransferase
MTHPDSILDDSKPASAATKGVHAAGQTMNLPNQLTIARVLMVPVFVGLMSFHHVGTLAAAYVVFTVATITDYYDGKIARERGQITNFGKLLDPVADKVLLAAAFIMLMGLPELNIPGWTIIAIIAREFLITGVRSLAASEGSIIGAIGSGKLKTVLQMTYIFVFLLLSVAWRVIDVFMQGNPAALNAARMIEKYSGPASMYAIAFVSLYTLYSGYDFARANWRNLKIT